jgi:ABC-type glycerol-3-phosphate transport system permease component
MAGSMLLTIPMVMVYFFSQRLLYEGANVLGRIRQRQKLSDSDGR